MNSGHVFCHAEHAWSRIHTNSHSESTLGVCFTHSDCSPTSEKPNSLNQSGTSHSHQQLYKEQHHHYWEANQNTQCGTLNHPQCNINCKSTSESVYKKHWHLLRVCKTTMKPIKILDKGKINCYTWKTKAHLTLTSWCTNQSTQVCFLASCEIMALICIRGLFFHFWLH